MSRKNLIYCSLCKTYYLVLGDKMLKLKIKEVTEEDKITCLNPRKRLGSYIHPINCGCAMRRG